MSINLETIVDDVPFLVYCFNSNMVIEHLFGKVAGELHLDRKSLIGVNLQQAKMLLPVSVIHARRALRGESFTAVLEFKKRVFEVVYQPKLVNDDNKTKIICPKFIPSYSRGPLRNFGK